MRGLLTCFSEALNPDFSYYCLCVMTEECRLPFNIDGVSTEVIRVPYYPQTPQDPYCYVCSLKMILAYFKNIYPNQTINQNTPDFTLNEIRRITRTHDTGTRGQNLVRDLESRVSTLRFELV